MRKFYISDIHGHYYPMMKLLEHVKFNPASDAIIFGGDMIDRGPDSARVVKEIKLLQDENPLNVKAVIGNHEEMMLWYLFGRSAMWLQYGGLEAARSFNEVFGVGSPEVDIYADWFSQLPIAIEDEDGVYCHSGIDFAYDLSNQPRDVLWTTYRQLFSYSKDEVLDYTNERKLYRGHDPVKEVKTDGARVCCDLGMGVLEEKHAKLALIDITNQEYYFYKESSKQIIHSKIKWF